MLILTAQAAPQTQLRMTIEVPGAPPCLCTIDELVRNIAVAAFGINVYTASKLVSELAAKSPIRIVSMPSAETIFQQEIHNIIWWRIHSNPTDYDIVKRLVSMFQLQISRR